MCDVYEDIDLNKSVFVEKDPKHFAILLYKITMMGLMHVKSNKF